MVLLQGDFNSRIGREKDYVGHDKSDLELGIENFDNQTLRNSDDKTTNLRGKDFLDICRLNDLLIVNGRYFWEVYKPQLEWL
jgi:hypothetical protein